MDNQQKTTRSFRCDPNLWGTYESMAQGLDCSIDFLVNEGMRHFARQRGIEGNVSARFIGEPPLPADTIIRQFLCRDSLWDLYSRANQGRAFDAWLNVALRSYASAKNYLGQEPQSEATLQEPLVAVAFSNRSTRRYTLSQLDEEIVLGKSFAFFKAGYFDNPSLTWLNHIYGVDLTRPTMASFLGGASLPGVSLESLPPQRFALVTSNQESYSSDEPVQLLIVFPGLVDQSALLDLWDESSHLASIPVCTRAHGIAVLSLHRLAEGEYRVTLRGTDPNEPPCLFTVSASAPSSSGKAEPRPGDPSGEARQMDSPVKPWNDGKRGGGAHNVSGIYLQQGEGRASPFLLRVNDGRLVLQAYQSASQVSVILLDPGFPMQRSDALDPNTVQHPAQYDELYRVCDRLFQAGQYSEASAALREARDKQRPPHPYYAYNIACCEALLGRGDKALSWVKTAIRDGFSDLEHIKADSDFTLLHKDARFQSLFTGGKVQLRYHEIKAGERVELPALSGALLIAAYIDGIPWEGWALHWDDTRISYAAVSIGG